MKLIHSSKYRLRTITMSFVLVLAAVSGVGVATSFVGTTPSAASPTTCPVGSTLQAARGGSPNDVQCVITSTGTPVGGIKHVWLIILENKSYDETFTGLNQNSYLWQTLRSRARCDELLRHGSLQHGQLHLDGLGPVSFLRRAGRLFYDGQHDQQQQRHHHDRHRGHVDRHRRDD